MKKSMKKAEKLKNVLLLQGVIVLYTVSSVMSKEASASGDNLLRFLFFFGMEFVILGVYAVLWQQMIKRFELSVAYANRSMAVVWTRMIDRFAAAMFFSVLIASMSQVLLKKSTMNTHRSVLGEYLNRYVLCGYGLLFASMLLTVYAYSGMPYKNGPVIESLGNVLVLVLGYYVFGERISVRKLVGIACIIIGIFIFNL